jgi:hypothetical protein
MLMIPFGFLPALLAEAGRMSFDSGDIVIVVGAVGVVITNIIAALKTNRAVSEVSAKADVIAGHVNSAATSQAKTIDGLRAEVSLLREMLAEKTQVAAVLAQATSDGRTVAENGGGENP